MEKDKVALTIYKTKDYDRFFYVKANRGINQPHKASLMKQIDSKGLYHSNPIIVNDRNKVTGQKFKDGKLKIMDGQHRFEAGKEKKEYIPYVIDNTFKEGDIIDYNIHVRTWTNQEYLDHYVGKKATNYLTLQAFVKEHKLGIPNSISILSGSIVGGTTMRLFKDGKFKIGDFELATKTADCIHDFQKNYENAKGMYFIRAMIRIVANEEYDHKRMMQKMTKFWSELNLHKTTTGYELALQNIYNKSAKTGTRVRFVKETEL